MNYVSQTKIYKLVILFISFIYYNVSQIQTFIQYCMFNGKAFIYVLLIKLIQKAFDL